MSFIVCLFSVLFFCGCCSEGELLCVLPLLQACLWFQGLPLSEPPSLFIYLFFIISHAIVLPGTGLPLFSVRSFCYLNKHINTAVYSACLAGEKSKENSGCASCVARRQSHAGRLMLVPAERFGLNMQSSPLLHLTSQKFYGLRGGRRTRATVFPQSREPQRDAFLSWRRQSDRLNPFSGLSAGSCSLPVKCDAGTTPWINSLEEP